MPTTVNFNPASIDCGVIPPGGTSIGSTRCEVLSAPVNVTASMSHDTSGGALTLLSVKSFITETQLEVPDPGELPPGTKPPPPVKVQVPVQQGQSNGVTPLAVVSGQYVEVNIQFAPTASTPDTSTATLLISGDTWNPVSIPIGANVGELAVSVPSIRVKSAWSATVEVTVKSVAGPKTTAKLTPYTSLPTEVPNVTVTPPSSSLSIGKGQSVTAKFTVSAADASPGSYDWAIGVWAFDNAQSFSVPVSIIVEYALSQYAVAGDRQARHRLPRQQPHSGPDARHPARGQDRLRARLRNRPAPVQPESHPGSSPGSRYPLPDRLAHQGLHGHRRPQARRRRQGGPRREDGQLPQSGER